MEKERKNKKSILLYIQYTIIFLILFSLSYISFIKLGKSFIWETDGFRQHYIILQDFSNIVRNIFKEGLTLFSWNMGLGLDVIGQYSYYILGDPFAYISLLFPMKYFKYLYQLLIILRIYCVGISFIIYCRYNKKDDSGVIIGAIIYTFCGYIIYAAVRHPYFTNPVIMLPLVFMGIDKILKENKYTFFTIMIAILAIMNYYFLYMITILAFIYAVVKYIVEYKQDGVKIFFIKFVKTILSYIVGVMIAGVFLLPTIYAFINSDRAGVDYTYYNLSYYEKLFFGQPDTGYWSKAYISSILILIIPVAILNIKNSKENKNTLINVIISIIILLVPFAGSVMNGFSFQSNRWIFGYSFFMAYLITINLRENIKYNGKEIISMLASLIIYVIMALISKYINRDFALITIALASFMIVFIILRNIQLNDGKLIKNICKTALFLTVGVNIIIYAWSVYNVKAGGYVNEFIDLSQIDKMYNNFENNIEKFNKSIEYIKEKDKEFYRIGTPIYTNNNMPIKYNYNGLNNYLSIGNGYISDLSKELLILGNNKTNALNELDSRTKITTLLGCKYYIAPIKKDYYIPYGYKLIKEYKNTKIYENKNNLTIGVFYDNYILQHDYKKLNPLEKEQALIDTAVLQEEVKDQDIVYNNDLVNNIKENTTKKINYNIIDKNNLINNHHININNKKTFEIEFDEALDCELYLYIEDLKFDLNKKYSIEVTYNNIKKKQSTRDKITSAYYEEKPNILFNLGYSKKHNKKIKIKFTTKGTYSFKNIEVIAVPMQQYEKSIKTLKENVFSIEEIKNNYIKGYIENENNGILQIATPYSKGWKAYVDDKEIKVLNVNTGFIGIPINKGKHKVYLKYYTPYLKIGIIISILGIIILIIMIVKSRKRK